MKQLLKLGWRNIFRNTRRTLLTGLVIGIGLAALIIQDAMILGMTEVIIDRATGTLSGEGQIHAEGYMETGEVELTLSSLGALEKKLENTPEIRTYAKRILTPGMATSPSHAESVLVMGMEPERERGVSAISKALIQGEYLPTDDRHGILVGRKLAELLDLSIGEKMVLTVAQAHTGELAQGLFRIRGIVYFGEPELDRGMVFINLPAGQKLLGMEGEVHEIAVTLSRGDLRDQPEHPIWKALSFGGNEALHWQNLTPSLKALLDLASYSNLIVGLILLVLVLLTIMNTLFMALFERMHEFGVLRAIGTTPGRLAALILVEAGSLAVVSCLLGILIGGGVNILFGLTGLDYSGIDIGGVTFRDPIYPQFALKQVTLFPVIVFLFTLCAALLPAYSVTKISPVKAMDQP